MFDVFYTNYLLRYVQDIVLPQMIRRHPTWSDQRIAGEAARLANQHFSSFGEWQAWGFLKGPTTAKIARTTMISVDETRSWLGRFYEMLPFPGNTEKLSGSATSRPC